MEDVKYPIVTKFCEDYCVECGAELKKERSECYDKLNFDDFELISFNNYGDRFEMKVLCVNANDITPLQVACFANAYLRVGNDKSSKGFAFGCKVTQLSRIMYEVEHYKGY